LIPHKTTLPTPDLKIGMFVSDLDRPWIETPFLLQGFLIETDAEIATLQQYCRLVTVDRSRSVGEAYSARSNSKDVRPPPPKPAAQRPSEAPPNDFVAICRQLRREPVSRRYATEPPLDPNTRQSRLEAELLYSAPIIDDLKKTLGSVHDAIAKLQSASINEVGAQVAELARGVERNPDAMIWLARLRSTDQYSYDHAVDVSVHLMVFGRYLGMPTAGIEQIGLAGLMQDVGKIHIPVRNSQQASPLSDEEYTLIQSHVASSIEMLLGHRDFPTSVLEIVASHHERADGSGYPRRLKGERICFHGELAGLVDSYCAMTRERAYGPAISSQKALESLIQMRGTKFREPVVDQFIQCIGLYPIGSLVELNTGEVAVVIQQNQVRRLKPRVIILLAPDKSVERHPITLDLMLDPPTPNGPPYRIIKALPANACGIDPAEFYLS
jgi:HD-GYP domain-containing protein (c-di-GMP phosphodiesterase class II)